MSFTACHLCDRGGRGNAADKCACGWKITETSKLGCHIGTPIVGAPVEPPKRTRSQRRYLEFLALDDGCTFSEFLAMGRGSA